MKLMNSWVDMLEAFPGIGGGEPPANCGLRLVAVALKGGDFSLKGLPMPQAPVETLAAEDAELNLSHVELPLGRDLGVW